MAHRSLCNLYCVEPHAAISHIVSLMIGFDPYVVYPKPVNIFCSLYEGTCSPSGGCVSVRQCVNVVIGLPGATAQAQEQTKPDSGGHHEHILQMPACHTNNKISKCLPITATAQHAGACRGSKPQAHNPKPSTQHMVCELRLAGESNALNDMPERMRAHSGAHV